MRFRPFAAVLLLIGAALSPAGGAEAADPQRIALIIGNSAYRESPLPNPVNDAKAMATALTEQGFTVILRQNATKADMEKSIADFGEKLQEGATGLFYYAGHGMQVSGRNFLIPIDAEIKSEQRVRLETVDVDVVLDQMAAAKSKVNMVILDACRNNPFERRFRSVGGGLAQINAPEGTLIAYATAPGKVAADGTGENGLYTEELLRAVRQPGLKVEKVFKTVRANVTRRSNGAQTPWEASSLVGDFYFKQQQAAAPVTPAEQPTLELALWDAVKGSNSPAELQAYLDKFPNGTFAPLARTRMAALSAPKAAATESRATTDPKAVAPAPKAGTPPAAKQAAVTDIDALGGPAARREQYAKFLASGEHRAFALAADKASGNGWTSDNADANRAMINATYNCTRLAKTVCHIYALNDGLESGTYDLFEKDSAAGLARLKPGAVKGFFRDENRDFGIPPRAELKGDSYHADTPMTLPGAKTVHTAALADMLAGGAKPLLIDTLDGNRHLTLPGAYWFRGAGSVKTEGNAQVGELTVKLVLGLVASKDAPIVVFCLSSQCWLSYNAALRLVEAGFTNVHWYRGGVEAWQGAGLPMVQSVFHAQF